MSASERTIESLLAENIALRKVNGGLRVKVLEMESIVCRTINQFQGKLSEREKDLSECRSMLAQYAARESIEIDQRVEAMKIEPVPAAP